LRQFGFNSAKLGRVPAGVILTFAVGCSTITECYHVKTGERVFVFTLTDDPETKLRG
jgi:hypothetical protein